MLRNLLVPRLLAKFTENTFIKNLRQSSNVLVTLNTNMAPSYQYPQAKREELNETYFGKKVIKEIYKIK